MQNGHGAFAAAVSALFAAAALFLATPGASADGVPTPAIPWAPESYTCYRALGPISIDGVIGEAAWERAQWTAPFVDIEGSAKPAPRFVTRAKMLWDSTFFYVAAEMEEPDVWATLTDRDAVIFHDNDFEVFIDPDGDTHEYYELEVNALGTEWDLLLLKPYRDGGPAVDSWDIQGLETAVAVDGTLNDPSDVDVGWSIEIAIPWAVLEECAHRSAPPRPGDRWRVNFSRVEWATEVRDGRYVKLTDPDTGRQLPEDNWVWSPQGLINMHYPEMWGFVEFSRDVPGAGEAASAVAQGAGAAAPPVIQGAGEAELGVTDTEVAAWALRLLYYAERAWFDRYGRYSVDSTELGLTEPPGGGHSWPPEIHVTPGLFEASVETAGGRTVRIRQDGRVW